MNLPNPNQSSGRLGSFFDGSGSLELRFRMMFDKRILEFGWFLFSFVSSVKSVGYKEILNVVLGGSVCC